MTNFKIEAVGRKNLPAALGRAKALVRGTERTAIVTLLSKRGETLGYYKVRREKYRK